MCNIHPYLYINSEKLAYLPTQIAPIQIYCGSWNPLHEGHTTLFREICSQNPLSLCLYEISIKRRGKANLTGTELENILSQFDTGILVTDAIFFVEKVHQLYSTFFLARDCRINFHVGFDTALRIYEDHKLEDIESFDCSFTVWARNGTIHDLPVIPKNFNEGIPYGKLYENISSTDIRSKMAGTKS